MKHISLLALACATLLADPVRAQDHADHAHPDPDAMDMPNMNHGKMDHDHGQVDRAKETRAGASDEIVIADLKRPLPINSEGSGTSRLPGNDAPMPGHHIMAGDWMLMAHGAVSLNRTDHSGPRGDAKTYATSMAMLMAQRDTAFGGVELRSMFSLEPAMDPAGYPNLFATGETAHGEPLVDRQHPHDLFMELAARMHVSAGNGSLFLYGGPVGEPALGPSAFMHRGSAANNPEPPITHHWFDSTHITYGVVTAGYTAPGWQIEASAFRGREPDERRWNIEKPKLDSWSVRATFNPGSNWALQASYGHITQPEATHPGEDENRFTASAHYADRRGLSAMLAFSAKDRVPGQTLTAWLAEANWMASPRDALFGRFENVANDELFPDHDDRLHDRAFRVSKFQIGYARHIPMDRFTLALGGSLNAYAKPDALDAAYGANPWGYTLFARLSLAR